jgi:hypothetical protein
MDVEVSKVKGAKAVFVMVGKLTSARGFVESDAAVWHVGRGRPAC